jgi:hypothetical protein
MHTIVFTKTCYSLTNFNTYPSFMHHGEILKNISLKFCKHDGLCPNLTLCCEINAHVNDIIVQHNIILICRGPCHIFAFPTKILRTTTFNDKFYTYIKKNHKEQSFSSKFSIIFKVMKFRSHDFKNVH